MANKEMTEKSAWVALVKAVFDNTNGKTFGWHGGSVQANLAGLMEAPIEDQLDFLRGIATRGCDRVIQEQISAAAVKTLEQAQGKATFQFLLEYTPGTRVGVARLTTVETCARSEYLGDLATLLKKKNAAAQALATQYGLTLTEKGRLEGTGSEEFQAYVGQKVQSPYWQERGAKRLAAEEAKKAAKAKGVGAEL